MAGAPVVKVERRRAERRPIKIMLRYRCVAGSGLIVNRLQYVGTIINVSSLGAGMKVKKDWAPNSVLELELPDSELGPARTAYARVVWMRGSNEEPGTYFLGLAFCKLKGGQQAAPAATAAAGPDPTAVLADCGYEGPLLASKLYVKYRCVSEGLFHDREYRGGLLMDVRSNGAIFTSRVDYPAGSLFELHLPDNPRCAARVIGGKAIWARAQQQPGQYRIGCLFVRLP